jgi:hypothetical protein
MRLNETMADLISAANGHLALPAQRCGSASLLWVNPRARQIDPEAFDRFGDMYHYGRHLLDKCAYLIASNGHVDDEFVVDRYGGSGIGHNGGSGRAGFINGYNVKGIGRTPLVSALTPQSHASGGAYLEECVRETIFSEIAALRLPHSAVPTLAIIDTGEIQDWKTTWMPTMERRTLLVRPAFLRPAHFERATGFISQNAREGGLDETRVERMFQQLLTRLTPGDVMQVYHALWTRWTEQLAWGFVNRLPHVSNTTSNISLDGRLVDFGAMTAVPSWARIASSYHREGFLEQINAIQNGVKSIGYYFGKHILGSQLLKGEREKSVSQVARRYELAMAREILNLLGVGWLWEMQYSQSAKECERLRLMVRRLALHFNCDSVDMLEYTPAPRLQFDLDEFWRSTDAPHLGELREELRRRLSISQIGDLRERRLFDEAAHAKFYFPEMKRAIYERLDFSVSTGAAPSPTDVATVIKEYVQAGLAVSGQGHVSTDHADVPKR